ASEGIRRFARRGHPARDRKRAVSGLRPAANRGLLRIVAGLFNIRYRRRGLGIAALAVGLVTMMTAYCAPTAIGLAVYGLIVYLNEPVVLAFQMGDSGRPL